jgi:hypothetical protein
MRAPGRCSGPLVILALLSSAAAGSALERFRRFLAPATRRHARSRQASGNLELILSIVAVALWRYLGWFIAHLLLPAEARAPAELAAALPGGYKLLANKYYVDEFYGATWSSRCWPSPPIFLGWVVDKAILGGAAWLLGGIATFCGALLQRWQSGNLRSYAAWLARARRRCCSSSWSLVNCAGNLRNSSQYGRGTENERDQQLDSHADPAGSAGRRGAGRARPRPRQAAQLDRAAHGAGHLRPHAPSALHYDLGKAASSLRSTALDRKPRHLLPRRRRRPEPLAGRPHRPAGAGRRAGQLERHAERRKIFFALFLVQQTAMFGVFISLDLMLYYGFWELSLVPMAILIAMYGRKDGPKAALNSSSSPSFPPRRCWWHSVALREDRQLRLSHSADPHRQRPLPCRPLCWAPCVPFRLCRQGPVFPLHGWLADTYSEAPVALAMVVAGKLGLYSMLRFHIGLFPVQARALAPYLIALAVIGILYGACLALVQRDFWRCSPLPPQPSEPDRSRHLRIHLHRLAGAVYQILNHGVVDGALFVLLGVLYDRYATSQINAYGGLASKLPRTATLFVITRWP